MYIVLIIFWMLCFSNWLFKLYNYSINGDLSESFIYISYSSGNEESIYGLLSWSGIPFECIKSSWS